MIAQSKEIIYVTGMFLWTWFRGNLRWKAVDSLAEGISVYYGHDRIPLPNEKTSGGIVKCQDLSKVYPNKLTGANILYLVSSALPPFPELLIKTAKKRGVKLVVNQNGVAIPAYHGNKLEVINRPRRFLLRNADHVIYQSLYCKLSSDTFLTKDISSFSILPNPVDTTQFSCKEEGLCKSIPVLLLAGSHGRFYRVKAAVDALRCLKEQGIEARLKIIGRLSWKTSVEQCVSETLQCCAGLKECVEIIGPYSQNEAAALYRTADILLHTQYNDACPRVVVEAMASGLPVVYSDSGGVGELVGTDAGIGIPVPKDWNTIHLPNPAEMAQGVAAVLEDYRHYSRKARERAASSLDVRTWLQRHTILFENLRKNCG